MKKFKIALVLMVLLFCMVVAGQAIDNRNDHIGSDAKSKVVVYYVPVTGYFSSKTNIDSADLQKQKIYTLQEDEADVLDILQNITFPEVVSEDRLKEEVSRGAVALIRWDRVTPDFKTLSWRGKYLFSRGDVDDYALKIEKEVVGSNLSQAFFDKEKLTKINFVGDIMLSRHVNTQMKRLGYDYPWEKVLNRMADADITFANLEVPISDLIAPPAEGMSFVASTENLTYIKKAGIDVVSVANNHSANFGRNVFEDNLKNLKKVGIGVCGGGRNEAEARSGYVIEKNGTRFGFICQSAITGSLYANGSDAGVPYLGIEPWYRDSSSSLKYLTNDIKLSGSKADVVIASPHWGVEYKNNPNSSQEKVAKLMIDSGVGLVMGTHPHVVQAVGYYKDRYIAYSLGNFIFDQEWSPETKQGVMASAYFYNNKNMAVNLMPLQIENYSQPGFVDGSVAEKIFGDIEEYSKGF